MARVLFCPLGPLGKRLVRSVNVFIHKRNIRNREQNTGASSGVSLDPPSGFSQPVQAMMTGAEFKERMKDSGFHNLGHVERLLNVYNGFSGEMEKPDWGRHHFALYILEELKKSCKEWLASFYVMETRTGYSPVMKSVAMLLDDIREEKAKLIGIMGSSGISLFGDDAFSRQFPEVSSVMANTFQVLWDDVSSVLKFRSNDLSEEGLEKAKNEFFADLHSIMVPIGGAALVSRALAMVGIRSIPGQEHQLPVYFMSQRESDDQPITKVYQELSKRMAMGLPHDLSHGMFWGLTDPVWFEQKRRKERALVPYTPEINLAVAFSRLLTLGEGHGLERMKSVSEVDEASFRHYAGWPERVYTKGFVREDINDFTDLADDASRLSYEMSSESESVDSTEEPGDFSMHFIKPNTELSGEEMESEL
ncbi:hypothetical protein FUAX_47610 (plasmid) [Fulvitalea axinellae]|uniref:Uncharacterized protein n=1 Tax=Fulvitalea axinellae TaxID=1182444 RepID=A0AAU9CJP1_9BACT|nr:hypothetical protein FUAX_47610 [Fulvitalea axinellae]